MVVASNKHPTPEEMDEPISVAPLTFEQIVESLLAAPPSKDDRRDDKADS